MSYFLVAIAAALWGITGIFYKSITAAGFNPLELSLARAFFSVIIMGTLCLLKDKNSLKLNKISDIKDFIPISIFGFCAYNVFYVMAVNATGVGVAGALFYTYPAFVLIQTRILSKEPITMKRVLVIAVTFIGCVCISGVLDGGARVSLKGVLYGVISGFSFAIYSVLGKKTAAKYDTGTINFYIFLVALVIFFIIGGPIKTTARIIETNTLFLMVSFTVVISILPYICYLRGLSKIDVGKASIITTIEPIVAAMVGVVVYKESMTATKWIGMILIVGAVCVMNSRIGESVPLEDEAIKEK